MKFLFLTLVFSSSIFADDDYKWSKAIGHGRRELGIVSTRVLDSIKDDLRIAVACETDELMVLGGCSAIYGFKLTTSFPNTLRATGSLTEWVCMGDKDMTSAISTPDGEITGALMVTIVC